MDWLANLTLPYILAAVAVLFVARVALGKYKSDAAKSAAEIVESALIAVVLVFLVIRPFIVQAFYIPTGSMEPTLLGHDYPTPVHDHILVNKFVYRFKDPRHGDIVVFKSPPGASNEGVESDFIKRLIGESGDVIEVRAGEGVYRNGKLLKEPYIAEVPLYDMAPIKVPKGEVFVMGDNRNNSNDSHVWGTLDKNRILGKAMVRFWPITRIGLPR